MGKIVLIFAFINILADFFGMSSKSKGSCKTAFKRKDYSCGGTVGNHWKFR